VDFILPRSTTSSIQRRCTGFVFIRSADIPGNRRSEKRSCKLGASSLSGTQRTAVDGAILLWNPDGVCDKLEKRGVRIPILFTIKRNDSGEGRRGDSSILQSFPSLNRRIGLVLGEVDLLLTLF
jgi:hypothetical protein